MKEREREANRIKGPRGNSERKKVRLRERERYKERAIRERTVGQKKRRKEC